MQTLVCRLGNAPQQLRKRETKTDTAHSLNIISRLSRYSEYCLNAEPSSIDMQEKEQREKLRRRRRRRKEALGSEIPEVQPCMKGPDCKVFYSDDDRAAL